MVVAGETVDRPATEELPRPLPGVGAIATDQRGAVHLNPGSERPPGIDLGQRRGDVAVPFRVRHQGNETGLQDRAERELGRVYRDIIGAHYPAMTAVDVSALIEQRALVEIEATAVIPDES